MKKILMIISLIVSHYFVFCQEAVKIEKAGSGRPILLLPGFTCPGSVWNSIIKGFNKVKETHAVTYAGFGGLAPVDFNTPWYLQIKNQLITYIKKEKLRNLVIIGHSMGGNLAIDLAAELPQYVSGLILVESIPCMRVLMMPDVPAKALQYDSPYNNNVIQMNDDAFKQMAITMSTNMTLDQTNIDKLVAWSLQADRKTYAYGYTDLLKLDLRDKLKNIGINTLILGASFPDKAMVQANYEKQYENLKLKNIVITDNSRHFIMFDQPVWFQNNINAYLEKNGKK